MTKKEAGVADKLRADIIKVIEKRVKEEKKVTVTTALQTMSVLMADMVLRFFVSCLKGERALTDGSNPGLDEIIDLKVGMTGQVSRLASLIDDRLDKAMELDRLHPKLGADKLALMFLEEENKR